MAWNPRHLRSLQAELERIWLGQTDRLMLFLPPRNGKSELCTVRFPLYLLEREADRRIVVGAYNQSLAERLSPRSRRLARELEREGRLALSAERRTAADWETAAGGGIRAVGVGSGVTGLGADLILIDDPVKSREEAESRAYRDRVWDWYRDDLYTRLEPGGAIVLIMTRWHEDDLAGRILTSEDAGTWRVVRLPAIAEGSCVGASRCVGSGLVQAEWENGRVGEWERSRAEAALGAGAVRLDLDERENGRMGEWETLGAETAPTLAFADSPIQNGKVGQRLGQDPPEPAAPVTAPNSPILPLTHSPIQKGREEQPHGLGFSTIGADWRTAGEALWPERFPVTELERTRRVLGERSFSALYQGRPQPAEGGLFRREWFRVVDRVPAGLRWVRFWDTAAKATERSDYWAGVLAARSADGNWYLRGMVRGRWEYPQAKQVVLQTAEADGPGVVAGIEDSANGSALIQDLRRDPRGARFPWVPVRVSAEKAVRAGTWASLAEGGLVHLEAGPWTAAFLDEVESFPWGKHDDQVDAVSGAVELVLRQGTVHRPRSLVGPPRSAWLPGWVIPPCLRGIGRWISVRCGDLIRETLPHRAPRRRRHPVSAWVRRDVAKRPATVGGATVSKERSEDCTRLRSIACRL